SEGIVYQQFRRQISDDHYSLQLHVINQPARRRVEHQEAKAIGDAQYKMWDRIAKVRYGFECRTGIGAYKLLGGPHVGQVGNEKHVAPESHKRSGVYGRNCGIWKSAPSVCRDQEICSDHKISRRAKICNVNQVRTSAVDYGQRHSQVVRHNHIEVSRIGTGVGIPCLDADDVGHANLEHLIGSPIHSRGANLDFVYFELSRDLGNGVEADLIEIGKSLSRADDVGDAVDVRCAAVGYYGGCVVRQGQRTPERLIILVGGAGLDVTADENVAPLHTKERPKNGREGRAVGAAGWIFEPAIGGGFENIGGELEQAVDGRCI